MKSQNKAGKTAAKKRKSAVVTGRARSGVPLSRAIGRRVQNSGRWTKIMGTVAALGLTGAAYAYYRNRGASKTSPTPDLGSTTDYSETSARHETDAEYMTS